MQAHEDGAPDHRARAVVGLCTGWIDEILTGRAHLACALDGAPRIAWRLVAALTAIMAAGCFVDVAWWNERMRGLRLLNGLGAARTYDDAAHAVVRIRDHLPQPIVEPRGRRPFSRLLAAPTTRVYPHGPVSLSRTRTLQRNGVRSSAMIRIGRLIHDQAGPLVWRALDRTRKLSGGAAAGAGSCHAASACRGQWRPRR